MKTIILLGGYGRIGSHIATWLLRKSDVQLVVAGRHADQARQHAEWLNRGFPGQRVRATFVDVASAQSLRSAFAGVDLAVDCTSTAQHIEQIARVALTTGVDCLEYHYSSKVLPALRPLAADLERAGRTFIAQAGFHPGLLAPLVRLVAPQFARYSRASVSFIMNFAGVSYTPSAAEFVEELGMYQPTLCRDGKWQPASYRDRRKFDFGPGFGVRTCVPLSFEELHGLPAQLGLRELGGYVGGFNWFVDSVVIPLSLVAGKVRRGLGAEWLGRCWLWAMNHIARPPYGVVMRLDAEGEADGGPLAVQVVLQHPDVFEFTGVAVVACLRQYLTGDIRPGLCLMGEAVEPGRLSADLQDMGVSVTRTPESVLPVRAA